MADTDRAFVIVGGGVIGVCCAYFLARRGARVTLLERDQIASGASFGNAGCIAPGHGSINKPGRVRQALRSLRDPLSPLYVAPRLDPSLARWLWLFSRSCTARHVEHNLSALAPLGHLTSALFDTLMETEGLDCHYRHDGYYEVYRTDRALRAAESEATLIRSRGYAPQVLSGPDMLHREPALAEGVAGAVFFPEAASIDPRAFVVGMAERAERHGASLRTGVSVRGLALRGNKVVGVDTAGQGVIPADDVILAAGAHTTELTRTLGIPLPLQPAKGYHRDRIPRTGHTPELRVTAMLGERSVFCTPMGGFVRFAGTLEFSGVNREMRRPRLEQLTRSARLYYRDMREDTSRSEWCGLRPCLADGLPAVGPVRRYPGLHLATGHAMLGLTLGPVTGQVVAEYLLDGTPSADISALDTDRFV